MPWPKGKPTAIRKANPQEIKRLYIDEKLSIEKVAERLGLGKTTVATWLRKLGLQRSISEAKKLYGSHRGERNRNWRGGRKHRGGYIYIYKPDHPMVSARNYYWPYVAEHILVWEKAHGRSLPPDWVVHHLNGIRTDNRPENLLALPKRKHSPMLNVKEVQRRLRQVENELRRIKSQGKLDLE